MNVNPVTRLVVTEVELTNGTKFSIVTDLPPDMAERMVNKWMRKAKRLTPMSLIDYLKERRPCIAVTKEQYDKVHAQYADQIVPATKEEWEAENPQSI